MTSKKPFKPVSKVSSSQKFFFLRYPYLFLPLLVWLVYVRTLGCGLTHFDDAIFVLDMKDYFNEWTNLLVSFKRGVFESGMYYRPVLLIDFIIEHHLFKENPSGYHFTNVLFHSIAAALFFRLLIRMKIGELTAFVVTAVFAVHPVLSHAVIWIPGRNDILLCIFLLASILNLINWLDHGTYKNLTWFVVFFLLSLFTKETAWLIPILFAAYIILFTPSKLIDRKMLFPFAGIVISLVVYILLKSQVKTSESLIRDDILTSLFSRIPIIHQYIGKILFPFNLSVVPLIEDTANFPGLIAVVLLIVIIFLTKSYKNRKALFGLFWFILFLFPLLLILPPINEKQLTFENPAYEHRLYISVVGFSFFISSFLNLEEIKNQAYKLYVWSALLLIFSAFSFMRIHYFDEALPFFERAVKDAPHSATSKVALASRIYRDPMQRQKALDLFNEAYRLNPNERYLNFFLGLDYIENGKPDKAEEHLKREIENTDFHEANFSLADLLFKKGEYDSAIYYLRKLVKANTKDDRVYNNLLILFIEKRDYISANEIIGIAQQNGVPLKQDMIYEVKKHLMQ